MNRIFLLLLLAITQPSWAQNPSSDLLAQETKMQYELELGIHSSEVFPDPEFVERFLVSVLQQDFQLSQKTLENLVNCYSWDSAVSFGPPKKKASLERVKIQTLALLNSTPALGWGVQKALSLKLQQTNSTDNILAILEILTKQPKLSTEVEKAIALVRASIKTQTIQGGPFDPTLSERIFGRSTYRKDLERRLQQKTSELEDLQARIADYSFKLERITLVGSARNLQPENKDAVKRKLEIWVSQFGGAESLVQDLYLKGISSLSPDQLLLLAQLSTTTTDLKLRKDLLGILERQVNLPEAAQRHLIDEAIETFRSKEQLREDTRLIRSNDLISPLVSQKTLVEDVAKKLRLLLGYWTWNTELGLKVTRYQDQLEMLKRVESLEKTKDFVSAPEALNKVAQQKQLERQIFDVDSSLEPRSSAKPTFASDGCKIVARKLKAAQMSRE